MREFGITIGFVNLICISFVFIKLILTFLYPSVFFVVVSKSLLRSRKNNSYFRLKFCSDAEARMLIKFENRLDEIDITIDLKCGKEWEEVLTCDLSYDYVKINAEYTT